LLRLYSNYRKKYRAREPCTENNAFTTGISDYGTPPKKRNALIGGALETLGASTGACAEALCDGYRRTNEQQDTFLLMSCLFVLGQLYVVFIDNVHKRERTCTTIAPLDHWQKCK
jgi:hypothetical protein